MGNSSIVRGTISIQVFDYLTSLLFCNESYNACTIVNLQDLQNSLLLVPYTNLLQYITKIYNMNLLLNSSSVLYSEVNGPERSLQFYDSVYVCIHCMRKVYSL